MMNIERLQQRLEDNYLFFTITEGNYNEATNYTVTIDNNLLRIERELEDSGFDFDDFVVDVKELPHVAKDVLRDLVIELANINNNYTLVEK